MRASEENNKSAVALLQQAKDAYTHGNFAQWVGEHGKEINAVIAQSPLLPNNGINSDSPRLRTGNPSPEGFAGYETDEPQ